jgi:hypothetical protein
LRSTGSSGHHPARSASGAGIVRPDGAQHLDQPATAETLEQRPQRGAQLGTDPVRLLGGRTLGDRLGRHPQAGTGAHDAGADARPAGRADDERLRAAGQHAGRLDARQRADLRVPVADLRHEEELPGLTGGRRGGDGFGRLGRDGDDHLRHDHAAREGAAREGCGR